MGTPKGIANKYCCAAKQQLSTLLSCSGKQQLLCNWKNRFSSLSAKVANIFFFSRNVNKTTSLWDRQEFSSQTKPSSYRNTRRVSKFQPSRRKLLKTEVRTEMICKAVVAAVPTRMKSLASVLLELLSQRKNPLCSLFSDSQWSTTKNPEKR